MSNTQTQIMKKTYTPSPLVRIKKAATLAAVNAAVAHLNEVRDQLTDEEVRMYLDYIKELDAQHTWGCNS